MNDVWDGFVRECKRHGLTVQKVDGWKTRSAGSFAPKGVMIHHTASPKTSGDIPCAGICTYGRSDLPGPLCNILIGRKGTVLLVASGRANHAGVGGPYAGIPRDQGNAYTLGIEVENDGVGEPWPDIQRKTMGIVTAILLNRLNQPARMAFAHREWTTRKVDPRGIDMDKFRTRVQKNLQELRK